MKPGQRLNRARTLSGYSVKQLSRETGISLRRIWRIESGANPRISEIQKLCRVLDMSASWWLLGDTAAPEVLAKRFLDMPADKREAVLGVMDLIRFIK